MRRPYLSTLWLIATSVMNTVFSMSCWSEGFTITLQNGMLYGPGNLGIHQLQDGSLSNFVVSAPLTGTIELDNNGPEKPNILAEELHVNPVDGKLSDGTLINENVNAGFVLTIKEPETKEEVTLFVCSISKEYVTEDRLGNLVFSLTAGFDPGLPDFVVTMPVKFVTGAAVIPVSDKTRTNRNDGHDFAGPYPSGHIHVGKLGDFDQDGFLDGEFTHGGIAPPELIIAEGDPILIIRPFKTDIPITAKNAAIYALRGITNNYSQAFDRALTKKIDQVLEDYFEDIELRINVIKENITRLRTRNRSLSSRPDSTTLDKSSVVRQLHSATDHIKRSKAAYSKRDYSSSKSAFSDMVSQLKSILQTLNN